MSGNEKRFTASVDQVDGDTVVLDVDGHAVRLPRELLPEGVREGAAYIFTLAPAPAREAELARSVHDRLAALLGGAGGGRPPPGSE